MSKATDNETTVLLLQQRLNQRGAKITEDGHGGSQTRTALNIYLPAMGTTPKTETIPVDAKAPASEKHYALALPYKGLTEQAGSGTHPELIPMFALTPSWLDRDDSKTAWCGIFRGWIGQKAGTGLPPEHYRAAEWANWGTKVARDMPSTWKRGDTIIMKRTGGYHVCLLDRVDGAYAWCLGGNQSNAVTIARFAISGITAVRR